MLNTSTRYDGAGAGGLLTLQQQTTQATTTLSRAVAEHAGDHTCTCMYKFAYAVTVVGGVSFHDGDVDVRVPTH